ncbi:uncharacterized protein DUF4345 [Haloactinospora alba]|uniref:Uncharacterized protein DUF4345 n=1 Tax=Haloactinospora alba TaxID=405555 RepID=A0A543NKT1_9ACTN|nr:DUF4345 domain-containing protein [Haloactinospora alba]TQN32475.1 uncharacterized protein DUF4345 [Haloactinospora alba]
MRRCLQVAVAVLALALAVIGLGEVALGAALFPGAGEAAASSDSAFRSSGLFWILAGVLALCAIPRIESVTLPFRLLVGAIFADGVVRLLSVLVDGWPHPVLIAALVLELVGMPLLFLAQARLVRAMNRTVRIPIT